MEKQQYVCPKCGNRGYESDQFQATGGNLQNYLMYKIKNLQLLVVKDVAIQNCTNHKLQLDGMF